MDKKPPSPKLIEGRSTYGRFWGVVEALLGRKVQTIRRPALSGNDEALPGGVASEKATHLYRTFNLAEEVVARKVGRAFEPSLMKKPDTDGLIFVE